MFPSATTAPFARNVARRGILVIFHSIFKFCYVLWSLLTVHRTSRNSVSVVRTTFEVYEKRQTLTLSQPKTPETIVTKSEWRDYVADPYHQKNWAQFAEGFFLPI